jgi:hypothetical protein
MAAGFEFSAISSSSFPEFKKVNAAIPITRTPQHLILNYCFS